MEVTDTRPGERFKHANPPQRASITNTFRLAGLRRRGRVTANKAARSHQERPSDHLLMTY